MKFTILLLLVIPFLAFAQRGKDDDYTVSEPNKLVNSYAYLTADAVVGATSITVNDNALLGGCFLSSLAQGDLLLILQMQGATMDIDITPASPVSSGGWGGIGTCPFEFLWDFNWMKDISKIAKWGAVTNYNNCGKFEQVEVSSVSGSNTITLNCGLQNDYTASGHVQIIRVPRFNNLTVNASASIIPSSWNGTIGGVVAIEVNGNLILNSNSKISANAMGFRGGSATTPSLQVGGGGGCAVQLNGPGNGSTQLGSNAPTEGGRKGEGIGGYDIEYSALYSAYGRGSTANGGGGGGYQNCGGGGGSNIGSGMYTGKGVPSSTVANSVWNLELAGFAGSSSSGGGRGGYALSNSNQNATVIGPNNTAWCASNNSSDARKENGGFGGHPLSYDASRLFMGGGGGAGDQDQNQGGSGGSGGGIVFISVYGTVSGTGSIEANGLAGGNSNPTNFQTAAPGQLKGNDAAGGGGGGGAIYLRNSNSLPSTLILSAIGGNGGNQNLVPGLYASIEAAGPGGAGAGGSITLVSGTPTQNVSGGIAGTTNSSHLTEFPFNGATNGSSGISGLTTTTYDIIPNNVSLCNAGSATLTVSVIGTIPGILNWYTAPFGGIVVATGNSFTTPIINSTTTYYVGVCPGTFRVPVTATVNPELVISGTANITNPSCNVAGSISGLTLTGGAIPYQITCNGIPSSTINCTNLLAGTYTLSVQDAVGCTVSSGPYILTGTSGPIINAAGVSIQNVSCSGSLGSISGITTTDLDLSYTWSNSAGSALDVFNLYAGSYTLTATDNNGCQSISGPYIVGEESGPQLDETATVIAPVRCNGTLGSISGIIASGNQLNYSWSNNGGSSLNALNLIQGTYVLTVTDNNGCTASSSLYIVNGPEGLSIDTSAMIVNPTSCISSTGSIYGIVINGGTNPVSSWSNGMATLDISSLAAGEYTIVIVDDESCSDSLTVNLSVAESPVIETTGMSSQSEHCGLADGGITGITVLGGTPPYIYQWNGSIAIGPDLSHVVAGSYILSVTDTQGCTATSTVIVDPESAPIIDTSGLTVSQPTCLIGGAINGLTVSGTGTYTYSWTGISQNTLSVSNLTVGAYTLTVTDNYGCSSSYGPVTILLPTNPVAEFIYSPTNPQVNKPVTFDNSSQNIITSLWDIDSTTISSENISYIFENEGSYEVLLIVTDANGCIDSTSQIITIMGGIEIPNVITDNSDGLNDFFVIKGLKANTSVLILNRWGEKVFESSNYANDWKGLDLSGDKLSEGVYTYLLKTQDGQIEQGFVHLIR